MYRMTAALLAARQISRDRFGISQAIQGFHRRLPYATERATDSAIISGAAMVQRSPALLAEAMELQLVNEHLLELRAQLSEHPRAIEA